MPKLLLNLRNVPDDEAEAVSALMDEAGIECYTTPPGPFGVTAGGIWLRDAEDHPRARALMDDFQAERARVARVEHEQARREGRAETFWSSLRSHPVRSLVYLGLAVFILMIFFAPMLALWQAG